MNTADAERMEGQLQAIGFEKADDPKDAQVLPSSPSPSPTPSPNPSPKP